MGLFGGGVDRSARNADRQNSQTSTGGPARGVERGDGGGSDFRTLQAVGGGGIAGIGGIGGPVAQPLSPIEQALAALQENLVLGQGAIGAGAQQGVEAFQPFANVGAPALESLQSGATLQGFGGNISDIFSGGALDPLIDERQRAATAQLASAGLTRSGGAAQAAADIPADLAIQLEQLLQGRQSQLAGFGERGATGIANIRGAEGVNLSNLFAQIGQAGSSAALGTGQADAARIEADRQRSANSLNNILSTVGTLAGIGSSFGLFSDIRLKTNIKKVCAVGPLTLCEWDWHPGIEELLDEPLMTTGFIAQDVKAHFPQFTGESHGFLTIDYNGLIEHLQEAA